MLRHLATHRVSQSNTFKPTSWWITRMWIVYLILVEANDKWRETAALISSQSCKISSHITVLWTFVFLVSDKVIDLFFKQAFPDRVSIFVPAVAETKLYPFMQPFSQLLLVHTKMLTKLKQSLFPPFSSYTIDNVASRQRLCITSFSLLQTTWVARVIVSAVI